LDISRTRTFPTSRPVWARRRGAHRRQKGKRSCLFPACRVETSQKCQRRRSSTKPNGLEAAAAYDCESLLLLCLVPVSPVPVHAKSQRARRPHIRRLPHHSNEVRTAWCEGSEASVCARWLSCYPGRCKLTSRGSRSPARPTRASFAGRRITLLACVAGYRRRLSCKVFERLSVPQRSSRV
jgi:hypothetical protein